MTQNTWPVLAGVQTVFTVPRNLWLATSEAGGGKYRKTEAGVLFAVACRCTLHGGGGGEGRQGGVTGKPVFHLCSKTCILKTPKKVVFGCYGSGWFHTRSSLFLEQPAFLPSIIFHLFLLSLNRSQLQKRFPASGEFFPAHR